MLSTTLPHITNHHHQPPALSGNRVIFAHTTGIYCYPEHKTPFMFVTNFLNKGNYRLNQKAVEVCDRNFYFLNEQDDLEIHFSKNLPLQTLLILFEPQFFQGSLQASNATAEELLDMPDACIQSDDRFPTVPFELSKSIQTKIMQLVQKSLPAMEADALLHALIGEIIVLRNKTMGRINQVSAMKIATREELYRRLMQAEEFMKDNCCEQLTLEQIAREVCLNKFHFLSTFKTVFNTTPYQYLKEMKLQKALQLLQSRQFTVTEICYQVGFESVGSFTNTFRRRFGLVPSAVVKT